MWVKKILSRRNNAGYAVLVQNYLICWLCRYVQNAPWLGYAECERTSTVTCAVTRKRLNW